MKCSAFLNCFLALVLAAGVGSCKKRVNTPARAGGGASQFVVDVITVAHGPLQETLDATGSLLARESVRLQAERAGIVREILFEEGKAVRAGDVLVVLDDSELRAQLARAQAQLELAMTTEKRQRELFQTGSLISAAEYEQSQANLTVARAESALIEAQLAKTRITAPFDGIAGLRQISVGAYVTPGTAIASIQDISSLRLDFSLPERYLGYFRPGKNVTFRIAGRPEIFEATIAAIEPSIDVATRSLLIRALAPNDSRQLLPGSFAEVEVVLDETPEAILIPPIALIPGLKQQTVFVHRNGQVEERKVESGLRTADAVQIVAGLRPGDEVVTSGILQLRPGMKVQVKRVSEPALSGAAGEIGSAETQGEGKAHGLSPVAAKESGL